MIILNPTGGTIRNDSHGQGFFRAPRGDRLHKGVDLTLPGGAGQLVLAPISGRFDRIVYPYKDDPKTMGGQFSNSNITVWMFYFKPEEYLIREKVVMGQVVGVAQTDHIHLQIGEHGEINPAILM